MDIEKAIEKAVSKYVCLQREDIMIERYNGIIVLGWPTFCDPYMDTPYWRRKVMQVARFLRKHTSEPIYDSFGLLKV